MSLRRVRHGLRWLIGLPADAYAWAYVRFRLNRLYHTLGLGGAAQLRLMPGRLHVTCGLMQQPYVVPRNAIRWGGRPAGGEARRGGGHGAGLVFDGDWDIMDRRPIDAYLADYIYSRTVLDFLRDGLPYQQTAQYREMLALVRSGATHEWQARGCRTEDDIAAYFEAMRHTFEQIRLHGYRTQIDLGEPDPFNEIKVFVDRHGELHKQQGAGHHRLAMACILGVPELPVLVMGVHREWALHCFSTFGQDVITSIDRWMAGTSPHERTRRGRA